MSRMSPRVKTEIPVKVGHQLSDNEMTITDLGVNGAFVRAEEIAESLGQESRVVLRYHVSPMGKLEHQGIVSRKENGGYAINFCDVDATARKKLLGFVTDHLTITNECPYCGKRFSDIPTSCPNCGWGLHFSSPGYFNYYEKICTAKKLYSKLSDLPIEQLHRINELIDADALESHGDDANVEFVGTGPAMMEIFSKIRKVAPTDLSVLILGESGTGKEMTAQAIHERSPRKNKPFIAINCGAIPDTLLEAELFGYEKGAFTGAYTSKIGKFESANQGTIFLDEIGEMPFTLQVKLLRFLQDKHVERIGAISGKCVDVRLIAATNCDLQSAISAGKFRNDLFYRLDEFTIQLPPVRTRGNDKVILAKYFLNKFSKEMKLPKAFTKEALEAIQLYEWPGNVREIINKIRRGMVMSGSSSVSPEDLDLVVPIPGKEAGNHHLSDVVTQLEIEKINEALNNCGRNISKAAHALGITRQTLHRRLKIYGIH